MKKRKHGRRRSVGGELQRRRSARQNASANDAKRRSVSRLSVGKRKSGSAKPKKSARRDWQRNAPQRKSARSAKRRSARRAKRKRPKIALHPKSENSSSSAAHQMLALALPLISFALLRLPVTVRLLDHLCSDPPTLRYHPRKGLSRFSPPQRRLL